MKSIILVVSFILFLFFGMGSFISMGIGGKYPKSNVWVFGTLSILFGLIFLVSLRWRDKK